MTINIANAATLNFLYTLESTQTISGSFDGDIAADNNTVENLRNFTAVYSGAPTVTFDNLEAGNFFNLDLSEFELIGRSSSSAEENLLLAVRGDNDTEGISVFVSPDNFDNDSTIVLDRFNVEVDSSQEPATTPEPGITLALILLGSFTCWQKLNKKQIPSL